MTTGLIRRNGRYSTRRVIPSDLQARYGRRELVRALGTADPAEARWLHARMWVALDDEFASVRMATPCGSQTIQIVVPAVQQVQTKPRLGTALSAMVDLWTKHQERPPATIKAMKLAVSRFEAVLGAKTIETVSRKDVATFIDRMREPGSVTPDGFTIGNMNSMLALLSALFGYAVRRNIIPVNPAANSQITDCRRPREKRREFDADALAAIFGSPIYSQGARPKGGAGEAAYWLPVLALYTGARINELCQLHPSDVMEETYTEPCGRSGKAWVLRIEENGARGQKLKTESSERRIPLHADLIGLGFIEYARSVSSEPLLFPLLRSTVPNRISGAWGQWFSDYLRGPCGVRDPRMTFHSFRHTFKHCARLSLIPQDVHDALTGHVSRKVADSYGALAYPLHPMVTAVAKYRVPGFVLPAPPQLLDKR